MLTPHQTCIRTLLSTYIIDLVLSAEGRPFHPSVPSSKFLILDEEDDETGGRRRLMAAAAVYPIRRLMAAAAVYPIIFVWPATGTSPKLPKRGDISSPFVFFSFLPPGR